jgi:sterol desaturase/sphingolipid hydroxylase (fatty acid hydroxylase superfamily)
MPDASDVLLFAAFWSVLFALAGAEVARPFQTAPKEGKGRLTTNFGFGLVNAILFALLPLWGTAGALWAAENGVGLMNRLAVPAAAAFVVTLLVRSLAIYLVHRALHAVPLLWRLHRVHHCDTAIDVSTSFRHHSLELLFSASVMTALAVLLGLSAPALLTYETLAIGSGLFTHANMRVPARIDAALRWLIVTPAMHLVHHSAEQAETDSNFGELFSFWDFLLGTYRGPGPEHLQAMRIGLGDAHDAQAASLWHQIKSPLAGERWARELVDERI